MVSHEEQEFDLNWVCCLLEDIPTTSCDQYISSLDSTLPPPPPLPLLHSFPNSISLSAGSQDSYEGSDVLEECCRKRVRTGFCAASSSKACREKMRRDRVNQRFLELSTLLKGGRTPKLDKAAILTDAIRMVKMLHQQASQLESQNMELKQKNNDLKAEKNELRAEKQSLKAEKQNIELQIKALGARHGLQIQPTAIPTSYAMPWQAVGAKLTPFVNYPGVPLWRFVPPTNVDTSQDHVLRPPVA